MFGKPMLLASIAVVTGVAAYAGWKLTARSAYEAAQYAVIESDGRFETRQYPDLMLAATATEFDAQGEDGSFMRLFRYIDGANAESEKVAMTIPVFMDDATDSERGEMAFVLPGDMPEEAVPTPSSERVRIRQRPGGQFAVVRFSGRLSTESAARAERELREWMQQQGLEGEPHATSAGYDPPWTPGPLRRNEVLIRLRDPFEKS